MNGRRIATGCIAGAVLIAAVSGLLALLPSVLTRGGLRAAVDTVVARLELPVRHDITGERFPAEVRDDGIGGAHPAGHGPTGIADRVAALGGRLELDSPAGGGTAVVATFPP